MTRMVNTIAFPKLNIELMINRVAFTLFGKDIYWYGIIIATGFLLGVCFAVYRAKKQGINPDAILDVVLWGLPVCIICARLFYVLGDPGVLDGGFWRIIAIWEGGIAIYGAIIGAVIVGVTYSLIKKINMGLLFDVCAPCIMIGQIIGRWGNFVNAEVYGRVTDSLFGMSINGGAGVEPLFLYESVWMTCGLILILLCEKRKKVDGEIFLSYILWYGVGRFFLETLRPEQYVLRIGALALSQLTAMLAVIASLAILMFLYFRRYKEKSAQKIKESNVMDKYTQLKEQIEMTRKELNELMDTEASQEQIYEKSCELDKLIDEETKIMLEMSK